MTKARDLADFLGDNTSLNTINNAYAAGTLVPSSTNPSLIINGDMVINERDTVFTNPNGAFPVDRFGVEQYVTTTTTQQSTTAPSGYSNSLLVTNGNAYTPTNANFTYRVYQNIEGFNTAPLLFGTSSAKTITISFWVRSSLTGTFGVAILNSAKDRSYVSTYTITQANTFEKKTITITGDTAGTWIGATNGIGLRLVFDLGSRPNRNASSANAWETGNFSRVSGCVEINSTTGATFYVTGVKLEEGSEATDFQHTSYGEELAKCQRYYRDATDADLSIESFNVTSGDNHYRTITLSPEMRANPTITFTSESHSGFDGLTVFRPYKGRFSFYDVATVTGRGTLQYSWTADAELY
jgi:hypothetical protein